MLEVRWVIFLILNPIKEVEDLRMRKDLSCVMCREGMRISLQIFTGQSSLTS